MQSTSCELDCRKGLDPEYDGDMSNSPRDEPSPRRRDDESDGRRRDRGSERPPRERLQRSRQKNGDYDDEDAQAWWDPQTKKTSE